MRFLSRDACAVLEDMEKCYETRNFSMLPGLIAEAKILASRTENLLELQNTQEMLMADVDRLDKKRRALRGELKEDD